MSFSSELPKALEYRKTIAICWLKKKKKKEGYPKPVLETSLLCVFSACKSVAEQASKKQKLFFKKTVNMFPFQSAAKRQRKQVLNGMASGAVQRLVIYEVNKLAYYKKLQSTKERIFCS